MRRLTWTEEHGRVSWNEADGRWLGAWERLRARTGVYASARGSMVGFVLDGAIEVGLGGGSAQVVAGEALLIRGTTPFRYAMQAGTRLFVTQVLASPPIELGLARVSAARVSRGVARALARAREDSPAALVRLAEAADELYRRDGVPISIPTTQSTALMLRIKQHLDRGFREPGLRIEKVARHFRVGSSYLSRQFSRVVGIPPKAYLQWLRVEDFLRSLLDRPRSIIDVAFEAGFSDYATFSRRLRRELGVPPSALVSSTKIKFPHARNGAAAQRGAHEARVVQANGGPRVPRRDPSLRR